MAVNLTNRHGFDLSSSAISRTNVAVVGASAVGRHTSRLTGDDAAPEVDSVPEDASTAVSNEEASEHHSPTDPAAAEHIEG